ncbi:pectin acetylesterase-family hydrolase [Pseudohaliea rubra]|uniref:Putative vtpJ-therm n=1 Tax=Pseudohaliea rubra DSM 19751 TaxID=1265313 RepID=A0A095WVX8_9GAMM|nr:pectin acetylesterase-family hydrolase [Pseudohaliea rubra]KGE02804.1 putative vtpJ-therm [Pseudohaliea rubra DSM 19751]
MFVRRPLFLALAVLTLAACSDSDNTLTNDPPPPPEPEPEPAPFAELYEQGVDRYLGLYTPMTSETEGDVVNHAFGAGDGPRCLTGGEYTMATRDQGSAELMIFLEGGGACWSDLCSATETAAPGIPPFGILNPGTPGNPVASWNTAYLPYCDGSIFSGDIDIDLDDDGMTDRYQRGLKNLSAALDVVANSFPSPERILLTGNSAGGFGTDYALPLVRKLFPDTPIELVNDSGVGISRPGLIDQFVEEWNAAAFIPASCDDCIGEDGHLTDYHKWQLGEDDNLRLGFMSTRQDTVIADVFVGIGGEAFEAALIPEMEELEAAYPERFRSFIANGNSHTFIQAQFDLAVQGTSVKEWIGLMLDGSADWVSLID